MWEKFSFTLLHFKGVTFLGVEQSGQKGHKIVQKNHYNAGHQVFDAHNFTGDPYLMA